MTRRRPRFLAFLAAAAAVLLLAAISGCGGSKGSVRNIAPDPEGESYGLGHDLFQAQNFSEASVQLKAYLDGNPAGVHAEDASYMLGVSYARRGDWASAQVELRNFVDRYPGSAHMPEVEYELARAYWRDARPAQYDQEKTLFTRDQLNRVLVMYPTSPHIADAKALMKLVRSRLAEHDTYNARLYLKLHQPKAVVVHAARVVEGYPDTPWYAEALYLLGEGQEKLKQDDPAREAYARLVREQPDSPWAGRARRALADLTPRRP